MESIGIKVYRCRCGKLCPYATPIGFCTLTACVNTDTDKEICSKTITFNANTFQRF